MKKRKIKTLLALLLAFVMLVSVAPVVAFAQESQDSEPHLYTNADELEANEFREFANGPTVHVTPLTARVMQDSQRSFGVRIRGIDGLTIPYAENFVTWSLYSPTEGTSIDASTGLLSIAPGVAPGTVITVVATYERPGAGAYTGVSADVVVTAPRSLTFDPDNARTHTGLTFTYAGVEVVYNVYRVAYVANPYTGVMVGGLNPATARNINLGDVHMMNITVPTSINGVAITNWDESPIMFESPWGMDGNAIVPAGGATPGIGGGDWTRAALSRGWVVARAGMRGISNMDEHGEYWNKMPNPIVDNKAALRYLHYNSGRIPGNTDRIFTFGFSSAGNAAASLGASGDSARYAPYLAALGAADASDAMFGVFVGAPVKTRQVVPSASAWLRFWDFDFTAALDNPNLTEDERFTLEIYQIMVNDFERWHNGLELTLNGQPFNTATPEGRAAVAAYYKSYVESSLLEFLNHIFATGFGGQFGPAAIEAYRATMKPTGGMFLGPAMPRNWFGFEYDDPDNPTSVVSVDFTWDQWWEYSWGIPNTNPKHVPPLRLDEGLLAYTIPLTDVLPNAVRDHAPPAFGFTPNSVGLRDELAVFLTDIGRSTLRHRGIIDLPGPVHDGYQWHNNYEDFLQFQIASLDPIFYILADMRNELAGDLAPTVAPHWWISKGAIDIMIFHPIFFNLGVALDMHPGVQSVNTHLIWDGGHTIGESFDISAAFDWAHSLPGMPAIAQTITLAETSGVVENNTQHVVEIPLTTAGMGATPTLTVSNLPNDVLLQGGMPTDVAGSYSVRLAPGTSAQPPFANAGQGTLRLTVRENAAPVVNHEITIAGGIDDLAAASFELTISEAQQPSEPTVYVTPLTARIMQGSQRSFGVRVRCPDGLTIPYAENFVTWSLYSPTDGISIDPSTGLLSVAPDVAPGTVITVVAAYEPPGAGRYIGLSADVSVTAPGSLTFDPGSARTHTGLTFTYAGVEVIYNVYRVTYVANPYTGVMVGGINPATARNVDLGNVHMMNITVPTSINGVAITDWDNSPILLESPWGGDANAMVEPPGGVTPGAQDNWSRAALSRGWVVARAGMRGIGAMDEHGQHWNKIPNPIVDQKAALRYLHYNADIIPGNMDLIFASGFSSGGSSAVSLGASGNSPRYAPYFAAIGAADARDDVFGVFPGAPVMTRHMEGSGTAWQRFWDFDFAAALAASGLTPEQIYSLEVYRALVEDFERWHNGLGLTLNGQPFNAATQAGREAMAAYYRSYVEESLLEYLNHIFANGFTTGTGAGAVTHFGAAAITAYRGTTMLPFVDAAGNPRPRDWFGYTFDDPANPTSIVSVDFTWDQWWEYHFSPAEMNPIQGKASSNRFAQPIGFLGADSSFPAYWLFEYNGVIPRFENDTMPVTPPSPANTAAVTSSTQRSFGLRDELGAVMSEIGIGWLQQRGVTYLPGPVHDGYRAFESFEALLQFQRETLDPIFYILSDLEGRLSVDIAPHWWVSTGAMDSVNNHPAYFNLGLALNMHPDVQNVNMELVWDITHSRATFDRSAAFDWAHSLPGMPAISQEIILEETSQIVENDIQHVIEIPLKTAALGTTPTLTVSNLPEGVLLQGGMPTDMVGSYSIRLAPAGAAVPDFANAGQGTLRLTVREGAAPVANHIISIHGGINDLAVTSFGLTISVAQPPPVMWTITFNTGGGSYVPAVSVPTGTAFRDIVADIEAPTREGYNFVTWRFATWDATVCSGNFFAGWHNTLIAVWEAVPPPVAMWTVTFDTGGGSYVPAVSVPSGTAFATVVAGIENPTRDGYTFVAWRFSNWDATVCSGNFFVNWHNTLIAVWQ